jgi:23S rRNA (guanosine2251-2'-O)-methyltransferase
MKAAGIWLHGLDSEAAETIASSPTPDRLGLVLGAEDSGLRRLTRETCDALLRLPTRPPIASLNVSNAAAIAIFATRQGQATAAD